MAMRQMISSISGMKIILEEVVNRVDVAHKVEVVDRADAVNRVEIEVVNMVEAVNDACIRVDDTQNDGGYLVN